MKYLIEIKGNKPLSAYGENHIIAYDSTNKNYYVTTADSFFAGQNKKIADILDKYTEINNRLKSIQEEQSAFVNLVNDENRRFKENFIRQYQETNRKLLGMVRELIEGKEE